VQLAALPPRTSAADATAACRAALVAASIRPEALEANANAARVGAAPAGEPLYSRASVTAGQGVGQ
jgi:hypothetical protein